MKITSLLLLTGMLPSFVWGSASAPRVSGLPYFFLENRGLTDPRVHFLLKRPGLSAYFLDGEVILQMQQHQVSMQLVHVNPKAVVEGSETMDSRASFFLGNDGKQWVTELPMHGAVTYRNAWPGVDMVYTGNGRTLKSEFHVAPGGDPSQIRWTYGFPFHASVLPDGSLSVGGQGLDVREDAPVIYQEKNGTKVIVTGAFAVGDDDSVGFRLGEYDHKVPLVIDPTLTFSSFLGGSGQDNATAVALDSNGNAYLAGYTTSTNFAQAETVKWHSAAGSVDAFVAKFSALGDKLVYCTYIGGAGDDRALGLAVDSAGSAYITGYTTSTNFPVSASSSMQRSLAGKRNAFLTKFTPAGNGIVFSTYVGGNGDDTAYAIALDSSNRPFIAGDTTSTNFPVTSNAFQKAPKGGQEAFIAQLNASGASLVYSTYLGGSGDEHATALAVTSSGNPIVGGSTHSSDFPTKSAMQPHSGGNQDAFVTELSSISGTLVFSTYIGGSGGTPGLPEEADGLAIDGQGNIFVAGTTSSLDFPVTVNGLQQRFAGGNTDGFLLKLNPSATEALFCTFIGGSSVDHVTGVAVDPMGYPFVTGYTASQDFPNIRAVQNSNKGEYDGFLYKTKPDGSSLIYATYLGGAGSDSVSAVAVDRFGNALLGGYTSSSDFPIAGVLGSAQKYKYGTLTSFLAKISSGWMPGLATSSSGTMSFSIDQAHDLGTDGTHSTLKVFGFGQPGDVPIFGDWNGSGTSKAGVVRGNLWMLDYNGNGVWDGPNGGDRQFSFGAAPMTPVVGDWNGSGTIKAGAFIEGVFVLDMSGLIQGQNNGQPSRYVTLGWSTDTPVVGDWTGSGITRLGVVHGNTWYLDTTGSGRANLFFNFGASGDKPLAGDWDGSGISRAGLYRNGIWYLGFDSAQPALSAYTFNFGSAASAGIVIK